MTNGKISYILKAASFKDSLGSVCFATTVGQALQVNHCKEGKLVFCVYDNSLSLK